MSYILDALRKAEAERERGSVPNIHAQPAFAGAPPGAARTRSRVWIVVAVVGVLLVVAAALPWFFMAGRSPAAAPVVAAAAPLAAAPVAVAPPASATAVPTAPASVVMAPPVVIAPAVPVPAAAPPARKPRPVASVAAPASAAASTPSTATAAAAPKTDERVYAMSELPDDIRRQLPAISVGGSMYSPTPASRLVIVNGQVLHEGERLTPDLVLQQIKLKTAVFAFKGYRFSVTF